MYEYLEDSPGYRNVIRESESGEVMELDTFSNKYGVSRYLFETGTGYAFVELCGGHISALSDYLSLKMGQIVLNSLDGIKIGWYGSDDPFASDSGPFYVDDIRFDSEVVWSVALKLCVEGKKR